MKNTEMEANGYNKGKKMEEEKQQSGGWWNYFCGTDEISAMNMYIRLDLLRQQVNVQERLRLHKDSSR